MKPSRCRAKSRVLFRPEIVPNLDEYQTTSDIGSQERCLAYSNKRHDQTRADVCENGALECEVISSYCASVSDKSRFNRMNEFS